MKTWFVPVIAAVLGAQTATQHHMVHDAETYAKVLEDPKRDTWQMPHNVIEALRLKPGDVIADIGAGTGYFTRRLAHHAGTVYAVDIDPKLLDMLKKGAPANVKPVLATADDPKLPSGAIDMIFFCDVLHHIENRPAYYAKLAKALKPGGRIVNVDFYKRETPIGPPMEMRLSEDQVVGEFRNAGFRKVESFDFLPYQYFLVFGR